MPKAHCISEEQARDAYLALGTGRSVARLAEALATVHGRAAPGQATLARWCAKGRWKAHALEHDKVVDQEARHLVVQRMRSLAEQQADFRVAAIMQARTLAMAALDMAQATLIGDRTKGINGIDLSDPTTLDSQRLLKFADLSAAIALRFEGWTPPPEDPHADKSVDQMRRELDTIVRYGKLLQAQIREEEKKQAVDVTPDAVE